MLIGPGTIGMMAATMVARIDDETFLDVYDRGGYIVQGVSLRELALRKIAAAAMDLAKEVEKRIEIEAKTEAKVDK